MFRSSSFESPFDPSISKLVQNKPVVGDGIELMDDKKTRRRIEDRPHGGRSPIMDG